MWRSERGSDNGGAEKEGHEGRKSVQSRKRGRFAGKIDVFHYCSVGCTLNSRWDGGGGSGSGDNTEKTFGFGRSGLYVTGVPDSVPSAAAAGTFADARKNFLFGEAFSRVSYRLNPSSPRARPVLFRASYPPAFLRPSQPPPVRCCFQQGSPPPPPSDISVRPPPKRT